MADENYKLAKFQAAVFAEIDLKTAQIKQEAELLKEQELEKNKDVQLDKSYNYIQKRSTEIKKKYKREVAKFSLDKKREVLIKRNEITDRIFSSVTTKLKDFSATPPYKDFLINAVKHFSQSENLTAVKLMLKPADIAFKDEIAPLFSCPCEISVNTNIAIGGFIAVNDSQGLYFDETLEQRLVEQKGYFMQHSDLSV